MGPGMMAAARRGALLVGLIIVCSACSGSMSQLRQAAEAQATANATATPEVPPTVTTMAEMHPVASPSPLVASPVPSLSPSPVGSGLPMRISAQLDPPVPRAGVEFSVRLIVANDGNRPAHGVYIATSGPWDRWAVLKVAPSGTFAHDAAGWRLISPIEIPPRESRAVEVRVRADAPTEEQLTFAVREAERGELQSLGPDAPRP